MAAARTISEQLSQFDSLLDAVCAEGVTPELVAGVRNLIDRTDLRCSKLVVALKQHTDFSHLGQPNIGTWMAETCHADRSEAESRIRQVALLEKLPKVADALDSGAIGIAHLKHLTSVVTTKRSPLAVRDEQVLVEQATRLDPQQFGIATRAWASHCDDVLNDPTDADARHARRDLSSRRLPDGTATLRGTLDELTAEAMDAVLDSIMTKPSPDDPRTPGQRRHDAFSEFLHDYLRRTDRPDVAGDRPHVTVTITSETGVATTTSGTVLPSFLRDTVCCDAMVTTVWLNSTGVPFDVGTPTSSIPIRNRRAAIARDRHCRYPGCARPARWGDVHHNQHRCRQGTHEITNLVVLCKFHHQLVHRRHLHVEFDDDGITLNVTWPDGRTYRSAPPGTVFS